MAQLERIKAEMPQELVGKSFTNFSTREVQFVAGKDLEEKSRVIWSNRKEAWDFVKARTLTNTLRNMLLMGRAGSGKSHLAAAAFFTGWEAGLKGRFFTFNQLADKLKATYDNPDGPSYAGLLEEYKQLPMLVIDDLGTQRPTEADIKIIYELINYRAGNTRLWTIVTTNLSGPQLAEWFGERVKSRLGKLYFDRLVIVAPDWRAEDW